MTCTILQPVLFLAIHADNAEQYHFLFYCSFRLPDRTDSFQEVEYICQHFLGTSFF